MAKIAILGFGVIGSGLYEVIGNCKRLIRERLKEDIEVKYILDIRDFSGHPQEKLIVKDIDTIINDPEIEVVAEMMGGSHPAVDYSLSLIRAGKSVVTSNKEVVANFGDQLLSEAVEHGVRYLFEASVGGGIPIIRTMNDSLCADPITGIAGILNGTTNYILTRMEDAGLSMEEALAEAQQKGYAERDPSADIDGIDASRKIAILAAIATGRLISQDRIAVRGIRDITKEDISSARAENKSIKLIGRMRLDENGELALSVSPERIALTDPLSSVRDVFNAIMVSGENTGDIMLYGRGAGKLPTAGAVLGDVIDVLETRGHLPSVRLWTRS